MMIQLPYALIVQPPAKAVHLIQFAQFVTQQICIESWVVQIVYAKMAISKMASIPVQLAAINVPPAKLPALIA